MQPLNRRAWLKGALASVAAGLFPFGGRGPELFRALADLGRPVSDAPWWLLQPIGRGSHVGYGWRVSGLSAIRDGAAVLALTHSDGAQANVHLCRRRGTARGIAHTRHLDLVLMNGGSGALPSDEPLGRVVLSLAKRVSRNESLASAELASLAAMMSHDERVLRFGEERLA